jgi:Uma2 family endonuclease
MSIATPTRLMTSEDLFALRPNKTVDRWLFRGELRETKVTMRNPSHSGTVSNAVFQLKSWLRTVRGPRGRVYSGEAYFRIRSNPDTNFGIDVALSTPQQAAKTGKKASFVDGPPVLAAEVLSPYDKQKDIAEKIEEYLDCGVRVVWIIDPYAETVTVHRRNAEPVMYTRSQELPGGKELPGFRCQVSELFE